MKKVSSITNKSVISDFGQHTLHLTVTLPHIACKAEDTHLEISIVSYSGTSDYG